MRSVVVVAVAAGQGAETDSGEGGKDSSLCLHAIGYLVLQTNKKKRKETPPKDVVWVS